MFFHAGNAEGMADAARGQDQVIIGNCLVVRFNQADISGAVGSGNIAGVATAIALAKKGNAVTCVDSDPGKVETLSRGRSPIFEKGLDREISNLMRLRRLQPTSETASAVRESDIVFLCVGTPSKGDGSLDSTQLQSASIAVGEGLHRAGSPRTPAVQTTVEVEIASGPLRWTAAGITSRTIAPNRTSTPIFRRRVSV